MKHLWKATYYVDLEVHKTTTYVVTDLTSVKGLKGKLKDNHECVEINLKKAVYLGEVKT